MVSGRHDIFRNSLEMYIISHKQNSCLLDDSIEKLKNRLGGAGETEKTPLMPSLCEQEAVNGYCNQN